MQKDARASLLIFVFGATLLAGSCSDTDATLSATQPTGVGTSAMVVTATSATASAQPVNDPVCPSVAPFNVRLGIIVSANGTAVTITRIRARFTDTFGRQAREVTLPMLPVTLPVAGPSTQFGVASPLFFERTFAVGIGCGTSSQGTVIIIVEGSDHRGRLVSEQVTVPVQ